MEAEKTRIEETPGVNKVLVPSSTQEFNLHEFTKRVQTYNTVKQTYLTSG